MENIQCPGCSRIFPNQRSLTVHAGRWCSNMAVTTADLPVAPSDDALYTPSTSPDIPHMEIDVSDDPFPYPDSASLPDESSIQNLDSSNVSGNSFSFCLLGDDGYKPSPELPEDRLLCLLDDYEKNYKNVPYNSEDKVCLQLLSILKKCNAPLGLYDSIMSWVVWALYDQKYRFPSKMRKRHSIINWLSQRTCHSTLSPDSNPTELRGSSASVDIITHSFCTSIFSILTCPQCAQDENYIFPGSEPGRPPLDPPPSVISDITHGSLYRKAWFDYCSPYDPKDSYHDHLVALCLFVDKTHTDVNGKLCVEPFQFTLGLLNKATRNQSWAW